MADPDKALADMVDVLYHQGRDAEFIVGAVIAYARQEKIPLPPLTFAEAGALDVVLEAASRRARELLNQASGYERKGWLGIAEETMTKHYKPLQEAVDALKPLSEGGG